jgi:uncharacterized membrane protein
MGKGPKLVNPKDLFFLRVILINVLLWMAIWNLGEYMVVYVEEMTKIPRFYLYISIIFICLALILSDIEIFEKL